jgi:hypothetical protein
MTLTGAGTVSLGYPGSLDHDDAKLESLRKDLVTITLELPGSNLDRNDRRQQSDQRCSLVSRPGTLQQIVAHWQQAHCARYRVGVSYAKHSLSQVRTSDRSPMNLVTGLWGMNVHVPGEGVDGVSRSGRLPWPILTVCELTNQLAWFGGILGCLVLFAVLGAFATVRRARWRPFCPI